MRLPLLPRTHWLREIDASDPVADQERICYLTSKYEFPWDLQQALSFALFRTYAVPSIGRLLNETGEFTERTQKRHDDTALLLDEMAEHGLESPSGRRAVRRINQMHGTARLESPSGRRAVRRINQMHGAYDIADDDMRYVLATFVVTPVRWINEYGWRRLRSVEIAAATAYYRRLGTLMGIRDLPETYDGFATLLDEYERTNFAFDEAARRVADATLDLLCSFYPRLAHRAVRNFALSIMDEHLRGALGYAAPPARFVRASRAALRFRGRLERLLPARRKAKQTKDLRIIRSYPNGFDVDALGTFPRSCPVPHSRVSARRAASS